MQGLWNLLRVLGAKRIFRLLLLVLLCPNKHASICPILVYCHLINAQIGIECPIIHFESRIMAFENEVYDRTNLVKYELNVKFLTDEVSNAW